MLETDRASPGLSLERRELLKLLLAESETAAPARIEPAGECEARPLSFVQERMWVSQRLAGDVRGGADSTCTRFTGRLDVAVLQRAIDEIVRRHEILRTTFVDSGEPLQCVLPHLEAPLAISDLRGLAEAERESELRRLIDADAREPFDLAHGPLFRIRLVHLADAAGLVAFSVHHIVFDGWSGRLFVQELAALYSAYLNEQPSPLEELPIQYADYAAWQRRAVLEAPVQKQLGYWKQQLAGRLPNLELPYDRPRPATRTFAGGNHAFRFSNSLSRALEALCRREGVTPFMALLAA
jgi:hypothetical protein